MGAASWEYEWRGSFLVLSGIILTCALFGALFIPPITPITTKYTLPEPSLLRNVVFIFFVISGIHPQYNIHIKIYTKIIS